MIEHLEKGVVLHTKDPSICTNAVYVACDELGYHSVISDFGNRICFTTGDLESNYKLPSWYLEYKELDYPFETLEDRLELQIHLLSTHLESLRGSK